MLSEALFAAVTTLKSVIIKGILPFGNATLRARRMLRKRERSANANTRRELRSPMTDYDRWQYIQQLSTKVYYTYRLTALSGVPITYYRALLVESG